MKLRDNAELRGAMFEELMEYRYEGKSMPDAIDAIVNACERALEAGCVTPGAMVPVFVTDSLTASEPVAFFRYADQAVKWAQNNYAGRYQVGGAAPSPETGTAAVPRPLDKAAEWARMSGVDSRDPGPAPEPVKPPATCPEWMAKGKCELEAGHEGDVHTTRRGSYVWSVPRTPAAGTAHPIGTCDTPPCNGCIP